MSDRLDVLLSGQLDGELTREERAELDALLAEHPERVLRARAFGDIDHGLKALSEEPGLSEDRRLAATYEGLRERLGLEESRAGARLLGRSVVPLLVAAAAAILFYLVLPTGPPETEEPSLIAEAADLEGDTGLAADLEDELVLVLGYGEEMSEINGITSEDLDVIEQLDLLDFLSSRDLVVDEMEDRG